MPTSHFSARRRPDHRGRLAAGLLGGLFGVGGGLIIVPGPDGAGIERKLAHGTSLGRFLPIGLASVVTYLAHGHVDWRVALFLSIGSIVGAIIGTTSAWT